MSDSQHHAAPLTSIRRRGMVVVTSPALALHSPGLPGLAWAFAAAALLCATLAFFGLL
ncbi:MAG: hypothetical protein M1415_00325 [Firmicutes bacterium]|nr:hypothetical protein [Bacillota bacterium]MCL5063788.1 hypothetical protein [Bacillota bacterium]